LLSGKELQRSLNEMVDFTRLETDQLEFQNISFNFRLVLEEIVDGFSDLAKRRGIELATLVSPYVPESVIGDPDRLHQILQSLLNNAFKFTHEGGITVKAECQIENDTHAVIDLEVADTGEGMPEEKVNAIRAAFEKREASFADRYGGLGIGLAISKELLELMGGSITLRSVEGVGTAFKLSIKMPKGAGLEANAELLQRHRLVLVTDSLRDQPKLLEYFQEWQLEVESCGSGPVALEKMRQTALAGQPCELVVIDLQQHKLAGVQLAQEIHRNPTFTNVRILLLAGDRDHLNLGAVHNLRLDAVLLKPVRKQMLHDAIATVLAMEQTEQQLLITDRSLLDANGKQTRRALLVDDNEVNQIIAKGALKKLGIHADVTNNGEEAIEAVMEKQYDFILMDCEMPIMDGFEATRSIRAWEQQSGGHLPIIALTASDSGDCHDACLQAGMDEYMQKPFRADQLETILQRIHIKPR
jgi:CheY-like chemotaxis protein